MEPMKLTVSSTTRKLDGPSSFEVGEAIGGVRVMAAGERLLRPTVVERMRVECAADDLPKPGAAVVVMLADRGLRVEVYRQLANVDGTEFTLDDHSHWEHRWRVVHASNGETMGSGEGYADKRDRDAAVQVLFPGVEVVEVDG